MDPLASFMARRGALSDLARHLGVTRGAICHWQRVPAHRVRQVSRFTGIPPHELRPDIFDPPHNVGSALSEPNQAGVSIPQTGEAA